MVIADTSSFTGCGKLPSRPWDRVVNCYSAIDRFFPACGLYDLTEGIYDGNPETPYEQAQRNQHDYLLDRIRCGPGQHVLDIGCGYGTLLERIRDRGAVGVGITISNEQAAHCHNKKLDVRLRDYRAIPKEWERQFDGVIANGSIEHFVQPADAVAGRVDEIYRHLFATVYRLINSNSTDRRFATTTIHFLSKPTHPNVLLKLPLVFPKGSDDFHWSVLGHGWGGYYPEIDQLRRCADGYFDLIEEVDGTEDYRLTSNEWLRRIRRALLSWRLVNIAIRSIPVFARCPGQLATLLLTVIRSESWNWQFRPPGPPTKLLRQIWAYRD